MPPGLIDADPANLVALAEGIHSKLSLPVALVCCLLRAGFIDAGPANLVALTEGIHSKEALELVREHMLGVMGAAASNKFSTELIKMSKFQMAQVSSTFAVAMGRWGGGTGWNTSGPIGKGCGHMQHSRVTLTARQDAGAR